MGFLTLIFAHLFAVVHTLLPECFFSVNVSRGFISSFGTEYYYDCTLIITAPSNHTVKLEFTIFQLSNDPLVPNADSFGQAKIQVHDGKRKSDPILGIFTGTRQPFTIQTSGRFMIVALQKDLIITPCNFKGTFYTTPKKG